MSFCASEWPKTCPKYFPFLWSYLNVQVDRFILTFSRHITYNCKTQRPKCKSCIMQHTHYYQACVYCAQDANVIAQYKHRHQRIELHYLKWLRLVNHMVIPLLKDDIGKARRSGVIWHQCCILYFFPIYRLNKISVSSFRSKEITCIWNGLHMLTKLSVTQIISKWIGGVLWKSLLS